MTPTDFKALFPEFSTVTDTVLQAQLDMALPSFNLSRWGDYLDEGMGSYVAHSLVLRGIQAVNGVSTDFNMKKVGDVQVQSSDLMLQKKAENPFMRSLYGQRYLYLVKIIGAGHLIA
ncbi:MAG: DUF4054 domain-containing protein [Pseudomonadota bacterium]